MLCFLLVLDLGAGLCQCPCFRATLFPLPPFQPLPLEERRFGGGVNDVDMSLIWEEKKRLSAAGWAADGQMIAEGVV